MRLTILLILSLLTSAFCWASDDIEAAKETLYAIQLGASNQPDMKRYNKVKSYGYLYTVDAQNGMLRVMLGTYTSKSKANAVLKKVKSRGFKDAFISGGYVTENKFYTVQFASYLYADKVDWDKLQQVGMVQVDASEGRIKLVSGNFSEKSTADDYKNSLRSMGYKDAFVRQVNEARLLNIGTNYNTTIISSSSSSSTTTTGGGGMTDMEKLPIYAKLNSFERENIVLLDGRYHMKMDDRTFVPLNDYQPGTLGGTIIVDSQPVTRTYSGGTIISSTPVTTTSNPTIISSSPVVTTSSPTVISSSPVVVGGTDYRIQLAAVRNYDPNQFSGVNSLGSVKLESAGTGVNRVMMGNYGTLGEAQAVLNAVKSQGFPTAYILRYSNGVRGGKVN